MTRPKRLWGGIWAIGAGKASDFILRRNMTELSP